jgi:hypothetical protein
MDWVHWEHDWHEQSAEQLREHVSLAMAVHDFIEKIAINDQIVTASLTQTRALERNLMRRLGEEYRSVDLLATNGHGFQAMSACANLFELAHTLGHIVNDDEATAKWFASDNRERGPWGVRTLVNWNGKKLGWDEARCDAEYFRYGFACGFKHNNPIFTRVLNLPTDSDLYLAQFALAEGANLALVGVTLVALLRLDDEECAATLRVGNNLFDRAAALIPRINEIVPTN